jgi:hypothetical protein
MLASLVFLTPTAGVVALAVLLPILAFLIAERRVERVRNVLLLEAPRGGLDLIVLAALAAAVLVLALAAAQPALADKSTQRVRTDAQVLFVVDTSASMAASSGAAGRTRLSRATAAAARLRAAIADVPSGVATLTDRVLPNLLPAPDAASFDATLNQAVAINEPPPRELNPRATSFGALAAVPGAGYFQPSARHRAVVLLTDGETTYFDAGNVGRAFAAKPRTDLVAVRFWRGNEAIYAPSGKSDPNYRPDANGKAQLASLAAATGGQAVEEGDLASAASSLRSLLGTGPTHAVGRTQRTHPLAPYVAVLALLPLLLVFRRKLQRA